MSTEQENKDLLVKNRESLVHLQNDVTNVKDAIATHDERLKIEQDLQQRDDAQVERDTAQVGRDTAQVDRNINQDHRDFVQGERDIAQHERDVIQHQQNISVDEMMDAVRRIEIILAGTLEKPGGLIKETADNIKDIRQELKGPPIPGLIERVDNTEKKIETLLLLHANEKLLREASIGTKVVVWNITKTVIPILLGFIGILYGLLSNPTFQKFLQQFVDKTVK